MKAIELMSKGLLIDLQDAWNLESGSFYIDSKGYVKRNIYITERRNPIGSQLLSRIIVNADPTQVIDHINRNPLDNRRCNLRIVSRAVNRLNTEKIIGVRLTTSGKYQARFKQKNLGSFNTYEEAKKQRDQAAKEFIENESH